MTQRAHVVVGEWGGMISRSIVYLSIGVAVCFFSGTMSFGQTVSPGVNRDECPQNPPSVQSRINCDMAQAMDLANHGRMPEAARLAERVWNETHDPAVGFAVVQLLEQSATSMPPACSLLPNQRAANIARELMVRKGLPESFQKELPEAIYREAVALAASGQLKIALDILTESFDAGYSGFEVALKEPVFQRSGLPVTMESVVEQARARAMERLTAESRDELAAFSSFPFNLETVDIEARDFSLESLHGKVVIVDFWGTWCPLCRQQTRSLVQLQKEFEDDLAVVGLAFENGHPELASETVRESILDHEINYRCVLGDPGIQKSVPGFPGFPTSLFLDRSGKVRLVIAGENSFEKYHSIVKLLLDEK